MSTRETAKHRGTLRGGRWLQSIAREFRDARLALGLSQRRVAQAVGIPRSTYTDIEHAKYRRLAVVVATELAAVLGIDLVIGLYPGPRALRDVASARMIAHVVEAVGSPLRARTEVGLPRVGDHPEQRAWDLAITGEAKRTGMEFEARLYDAQNQVRRHNLKRQDDPVDSFVLVVADTERNREALRLYPDVFSDLPRLRSADVLKALRAGKHPPTGYMLLRLRPTRGTDDAQDDGASD